MLQIVPRPAEQPTRGILRFLDRIAYRDPAVRDLESVAWCLYATRKQGRRPVGGKLCLTNQRVLFVANRLDHRLRADWGCDLASVLSVAVEERKEGGALRALPRRLRIDTTHGSESSSSASRMHSLSALTPSSRTRAQGAAPARSRRGGHWPSGLAAPRSRPTRVVRSPTCSNVGKRSGCS
jgi:hypothetical protein